MKLEDKDIINRTREALGLAGGAAGSVVPIIKGGSDRVYCRVHMGSRTAIFVQYNPSREENNYFVSIAGFLESIGVRTPHIFLHDKKSCVVVMEDVGERDLWSFRRKSWEVRRPLYFSALEMIRKLHVLPLNASSVQSISMMKGFDSGLYLWEREYFRDNFLEALCQIRLSSSAAEALEKELASLAGRIEQRGKQLIHRDFQSQNIMIDNQGPVFIDFQGMRTGCLFYDLGSLLYDPYVSLNDSERRELLFFYFQLLDSQMSKDEFDVYFYEASVQRLMQALGAYGFLGMKKKMPGFLKHASPGFNNLLDAVSHLDTIPVLRDISEKCLPIVKRKFSRNR